MGFLSRFFGPKIEEKEVSLDNLKQLTNDLINKRTEKINQNVDEIYSNIKKIKSKLKENLYSLRNAELQNKKIPTRAKQLMEGNREAYVRKVSNFIERIELPEKDNYSEIIDFTESFNENMDNLNKSSYKGYQVMKEFFYNQTTDIAMSLKQLNENVKNLNKLMKGKELSKISSIKELINNLYKSKSKKEKLKQEIVEQKDIVEDSKNRIEAIQKKFENIKKSTEYENYKKTYEEKEQNIKRIENEKDELIQYFAVLEKSLKKYKRDSLDEKLIDKYLNDPNKALINDNYDIIEVLQKLKENIENNNLGLKEKKKEKTLDVINKLDKDFLSKKKFNLEQLARTNAILNERLQKNKINNDYQEEKYKSEHFEKKLVKDKQKLEDLEKEKTNIDIEKIKKQIKKEFLELFKIKLKFINDF